MGYIYDKLLEGKLPGYKSIPQVAQDFSFDGWSNPERIGALIAAQAQKAGMIGFTTTLLGGPAIIATLPFNVAGVFCLQIQMVGAIAKIKGYDIKSRQVKTFVLGCLLGQKFSEILKASGTQIGSSVAVNLLTNLSPELMVRINRKIGLRLAKKVGTKGVIKFWKAIPIVSGVICGGFDWRATSMVGKTAETISLV